MQLADLPDQQHAVKLGHKFQPDFIFDCHPAYLQVELNRSLQQTSFHKLPLRFTMPHGLRGTPQAQVMLWKHLISPSCC